MKRIFTEEIIEDSNEGSTKKVRKTKVTVSVQHIDTVAEAE